MKDNKSQPTNVGLIALIIGILFFISVFSSYSINFFGTSISDDPNDWGVLGDFIGGMVNPLLGLVTIWLLTVSLRQNNEMLDQARKELKATLEELKRGQQIQAATEIALSTQIEIAQSTRDLDGAIKLISYWQEKHNVLLAVGRDEFEYYHKLGNPDKAHERREAYNQLALTALKEINKFDHILSLEEKQLLKKYPSDQTIYE